MSQKIETLGVDSYKIKVKDGGTFTFDSGSGAGTFTITGNLNVLGTQTSIGSSDLVVDDNTIIVNNGESGPGVSLGTAGLVIDRGEDESSAFNTQILFNESKNTFVNGGDIAGAFELSDTSGRLMSLWTSAIRTNNNENIALIPGPSGDGVVSVGGAANYEGRIYSFDVDGNIEYDALTTDRLVSTTEEAALSTIKLLKDYVRSYHLYNFQDRIKNDYDSDTEVVTYDFEEDPSVLNSRVEVVVDGTEIAEFNYGGSSEQLVIKNLNINGGTSTITNNNTFGNLTLTTNGAGYVALDGVTNFTTQTDPSSAPSDGVLVYSKAIGDGGSGVFFHHQDDTQDELVSRNKALLFSIIF
jgi:hypothetical protein